MNLQEKFDACKGIVGKSFPYRDCFEYPHGRMESAKVTDVTWFSAAWFDVHLDVTFTDGYTAAYVTGGEWFFEDNKNLFNN